MPVDEEQLLAQQLQEPAVRVTPRNAEVPSGSSPPNPLQLQRWSPLCQWAICGNGVYRAAADTVRKLEAGVYSVGSDPDGLFFRQQSVVSDDLIELPDAATVRVLAGIRKFWKSRRTYAKHGLTFKRGVLLWGPPGSGKTATVLMLMRELTDADGVVLLGTNPNFTSVAIVTLRAIEPGRPLIVVLEDLDEIVQEYGEAHLLGMLDGETSVENVVFVATTNYPERLGARIINRPSRFDERVYVGMPSEAARRAYIRKTAESLDDGMVETWVKDTDGFSIAHLRELVAACFCLGQSYPDVVKRLKAMCERPKDVEGFSKRTIGLT